MSGRGLRIFRILGFDVRIDVSWFVIAALVTWSLATGFFPDAAEGFGAAVYWTMGVFSAAGLFLSIVFHELCHSLAARRFGIPMRGITLFVFGGVAEMSEEPPGPAAEFWMAAAGPASSIVLALALRLLVVTGRGAGWPAPLVEPLSYLSLLNGVLAVFNLLPAFPLDGGRILRSILWKHGGDLRRATRIASAIGVGFALLMMAAGIVRILMEDFLGLWWLMIGFFLRGAAEASYRQLLARSALTGTSVRDFMRTDPVAVSSGVTVAELVDSYVYRYHYKMFPVVDDGVLTGCVSLDDIRHVPRDLWPVRKVGEIRQSCLTGHTISPDEDALKALSFMNRSGRSRLMVVQDGRLVGILSLKDMMGFLAVRFALDRPDGISGRP